ncbi:MAG: outer membrane beta-barrel protein [Myxococcales bacterium]
MSRRLVFALPFALAALAPATSLAADDCPDGWFCEDNAAPRRPPAGSPGAPPGAQPGAPPGAPPRPDRPPTPPSAYNPPSYPPPGYEPEMHFDVPENPPAKKRRRGSYREWGFNLHLEAALLGNKQERASNAGMAGLGFGFRYRPIPHLAFEAGVDLLTGTDFQGYSRSEAGLLLNTLVFFNPHDVVQLYGLGGLGFSGATVTVAPRSGEQWFQRHDEHYSYFGGQLGLGVEVRVTRRVALSGDIIGFVRGRTDDLADDVPEFTDPNTHRTTNTSGGGLLRVGASFYW